MQKDTEKSQRAEKLQSLGKDEMFTHQSIGSGSAEGASGFGLFFKFNLTFLLIVKNQADIKKDSLAKF